MTIDDLKGFYNTLDYALYEVQLSSDDVLIKKLKTFYKNKLSKHHDVTFICSDGKPIYGHKLVMSLRSDYFDTLFQYEPNKVQFDMPQFDSKLMSVIIKSMVEINLEDIEEVGYVDYLQAADFLQLNDLIDAISKLISQKEITTANVFEILELTQNLKAPILQDGCLKFIKENIKNKEIQSKLSDLKKEILIKVFSEPRPDLKDENGRKADQMEVILLFLETLNSVLKAQGNIEDIESYFDQCFRKDHLYFFATKDESTGKHCINRDTELLRTKIVLVQSSLLNRD